MYFKFVLMLTVALCAVLVVAWRFQFFNQQQRGVIIVLNGPSASGKSSIQKELQKISKKPLLAVGLDSFFVGVMPPRYYLEECKESDTNQIVMKGLASQDAQGPLFDLHIGALGRKIIYGMHRACAGYAAEGNNLVVDYILYDTSWISHLRQSLSGFKVFYVGIKIPLNILEQREKSRATSPQGHARSHYASVHQGMVYDLEIDSGHLSAAEAARVIATFLKSRGIDL